MPFVIKGLLFDKDGTLFDFTASWGGWTRALLTDLAQQGRDLETLAQKVGYDLGSGQFARSSPVIAGTPDDICDVLEITEDQRAALILSAMHAPQSEAAPLAPLLGRLRAAGLVLGVATNDAEDVARAHLAHVADQFAFFAGFDSGFGAKPMPGMQQAFLAQTGLAPGAVAMVGDSRHDLIAGRKAGMVCVAVLTGVATAEDLAPCADLVLPDISHLPRWLGL